MLKRNEVFTNPVKERLLKREPTIGAWLQGANSVTAEVMAKAGFDWKNVGDALAKLGEETAELGEAVDFKDKNAVEDELGDVLFAAVKVARFAGVDPEDALNRTCDKFTERFRHVESSVLASGRRMEDCVLDELIGLYEEAKAEESD